MLWETSIMFDTRKTLFLRSGDDLALNYEGGGAVMIEGGNPDNSHGWFWLE